MNADERKAAEITSILEAAARRYDETAKAHEEAREAAAAAVRQALRKGIPPTTVTELSPFTATYVRQIARDAGIPAATTRRRPQRKAAD